MAVGAGKRVRLTSKTHQLQDQALPVGEVPVVRELAGALNWFNDSAQRCGGAEYLQRLGRQLEGIRVSTAFSGIGAADVAVEAIAKGLEHHLQRPVRTVNCFAIEWSKEGQLELQCLPNPPQCLYGDIRGLIDLRIRGALLEAADRMDYDDLVRVAMSPSFCSAAAPCLLHRRDCFCERADIHVAGPPCVDFSAVGKRQGVQGPTLLPFLVWVAQRLRLQEPVILHENVPQFAVELLAQFFSQEYIIQSSVFNAFELGHACDRERRLTWLLHKAHVRAPLINWPGALPLFRRRCAMTWEAYLVSEDAEQGRELEWALARQRQRKGGEEAEEAQAASPGSKWSRSPTASPSHRARSCQPEHPRAPTSRRRLELLLEGSTAHPGPLPPPRPRPGDLRFLQALTPMEKRYLDDYYTLCPTKYGVVQLNQNPLLHPMHNHGRPVLQCIVKSNHLLFSLEHQRWLTNTELLLALAFPAVPAFAPHGEQCSFSEPREHRGFTPRKCHIVAQQVGNSMNVNAIGAALMWVCGFVEFATQRAQAAEAAAAASEAGANVVAQLVAQKRRACT